MTHISPASLNGYILAAPLGALMAEARSLRDDVHGNCLTYSRKVFIPLTTLCRDSCGYCTFAKAPGKIHNAYLSLDEVLEIAQRGVAAGCKEALFTLGDRPEARYSVARQSLATLGSGTTIGYLAQACRAVIEQTGLLPHVNCGVVSPEEMATLRRHFASWGLMLEQLPDRLARNGGPHWRSPDKTAKVRLRALEVAGEMRVPTTTGILVGIGETRAERIDGLNAIADMHKRFGHIQEVIIQGFRPKPATRMHDHPPAALEEILWSISAARLLLPPEISIQSPPNLSPHSASSLIDAGIDDWGGVSPVTPDHVNPEAPWPSLKRLEQDTSAAGKLLVERLAVRPAYLADPDRWLDADIAKRILRHSDSSGWARTDNWRAGRSGSTPAISKAGVACEPIRLLIDRCRAGDDLDETDVTRLFEVRGDDFGATIEAANNLRRSVCGDTITYVINRNINYTNLCTYGCGFCAFSKGRLGDTLRGPAYNLSYEEIGARAVEAWQRGATEVCLQGGIHPRYTGAHYLKVVETIRAVLPDIHIHAFSPLEIDHGARTLGLSPEEFLFELKSAGLGTLPGTAAEILDDEIRRRICPDKINSGRWLEIIATAHSIGLRTTATMMFGHTERPVHWARHLLALRGLQHRTGGLTEFVPLPFVHTEAPIYLKGRARQGPTFREALLVHAIARLVLHPYVRNIQTSWVKMGPEGAAATLQAGANDLGGTLMDESISRAAGAQHGQGLDAVQMQNLANSIGRNARERTTLYAPAPPLSARAHLSNSVLEL